MEIYCGINCFSPELNASLGVNHHCTGLFSDCTDHPFGNTGHMMSLWRAWFVCISAGRGDISEGLIVIFSQSIIAPELLDLVTPWVYSDLK